MKKRCVLVAVAVLLVAPTFAAVELGGNVSFAPFSGSQIDFGGDAGKARLREICPVGMQTAATFFFGEMRPFNVGLNLGLAWDGTRFVRYEGRRHRVDGAGNFTMQAGPAFEFMVGRHALFVSPGAFFNVMAVWDERGQRDVYDAAVACEYGLHVGGGYRFWVVRQKRFGVGLDFGVDYAVGLGWFCHGTFDDKGKAVDDTEDFSDWYDVANMQRVKVYMGVVFRLGK